MLVRILPRRNPTSIVRYDQTPRRYVNVHRYTNLENTYVAGSVKNFPRIVTSSPRAQDGSSDDGRAADTIFPGDPVRLSRDGMIMIYCFIHKTCLQLYNRPVRSTLTHTTQLKLNEWRLHSSVTPHSSLMRMRSNLAILCVRL